MIRKTDKGYKVVSESGKNMSKPNLRLEQAKRRLQQIHYFKSLHKKRGM